MLVSIRFLFNKELDEQIDTIIEEDLDALDSDIEATNKDLRNGLRQRVEAVKKGIKDKKDDLRQRIETAKKGAKDRANKEAEEALNRMEEDLSKEDLESAHIHRWIANQWLKASR